MPLIGFLNSRISGLVAVRQADCAGWIRNTHTTGHHRGCRCDDCPNPANVIQEHPRGKLTRRTSVLLTVLPAPRVSLEWRGFLPAYSVGIRPADYLWFEGVAPLRPATVVFPTEMSLHDSNPILVRSLILASFEDSPSLWVRHECRNYFLVPHEIFVVLGVSSDCLCKNRGHFLVTPKFFTRGRPRALRRWRSTIGESLGEEHVAVYPPLCLGVSRLLDSITVVVY